MKGLFLSERYANIAIAKSIAKTNETWIENHLKPVPKPFGNSQQGQGYCEGGVLQSKNYFKAQPETHGHVQRMRSFIDVIKQKEQALLIGGGSKLPILGPYIYEIFQILIDNLFRSGAPNLFKNLGAGSAWFLRFPSKRALFASRIKQTRRGGEIIRTSD